MVDGLTSKLPRVNTLTGQPQHDVALLLSGRTKAGGELDHHRRVSRDDLLAVAVEDRLDGMSAELGVAQHKLHWAVGAGEISRQGPALIGERTLE